MYKVIFHELVEKKDFKKIPKKDLEKIFRVIYKKLANDPISFGKPLTKELKGFFRLRIDPYRVVYRVEGKKLIVFILMIHFVSILFD